MSEENKYKDLNMEDEANQLMVKLVLELLNDSKMIPKESLEPLFEVLDFPKLYETIEDIRELSAALGKGELQKVVSNKGYILSNLKALQAGMRHLTWQTQKIANGDFTQKVDFLGEFSNSFNQMVDHLRDNSEHLQQLAHIDALTQIPNRLALDGFLKKAFQNCKSQKKELSIILIDIDWFKHVNDTYGHQAGDVVLRELGQRLSQEFRSGDVFARYGGEEFMAVLPAASLENTIRIGERILGVVRNMSIRISPELVLSITVSMGISNMREEDEDYEGIVKRSDSALYEAKNSGRNCLRCQ